MTRTIVKLAVAAGAAMIARRVVRALLAPRAAEGLEDLGAGPELDEAEVVIVAVYDDPVITDPVTEISSEAQTGPYRY